MASLSVAELLPDEPPHDQVVFEAWLRRYWPDLLSSLAGAFPDVGTVDDLAALAGVLRERGISLTLDLVPNHVARELVPHLGGQAHRQVSELAYHDSLMVQIWSALAAQDARLMCPALNRFPAEPPSTSLGTYIRCRRHRLGDRRRRRGLGRARRLRPPSVPVRLVRRRLPRQRQSRAGVQGEPDVR